MLKILSLIEERERESIRQVRYIDYGWLPV